jgi:hypothetical protein
MPDSGLFAVLVALFVATIIGSNTPESGDGVMSLMASEVSLLAVEQSSRDAPAEGEPSSVNLEDPNAYIKIPNFVFSHLAVEAYTPDRMACQRLCNEKPLCRSYSYREPSDEELEAAKNKQPVEDDEDKAQKTNDAIKNPPRPPGVCMWSVEGLHYRIGWKFFTKAKDVDWMGRPHLTTENFHEFTGLEYQESNYKTLQNEELASCKDKCAKDPKCGAVSYNEKHLLCRLAGSGVHYDAGFDYYEKPVEQENGPTESDFSINAAMLSSQETSAKNAAKQAGMVAKAKRDKEQLAHARFMAAHKAVKEKERKASALSAAEQGLLQMKKKEKDTKYDFKVQAAFQQGYFASRGAAQEKKTKEVKLKALELANLEGEEKRKHQQSSGEFTHKQQQRAKETKIMWHELNIQTAKEKLQRLKNEQMEAGLKKQEHSYENLATEEKDAIAAVEKAHEEKVAALKRHVGKLKQHLEIEQEKLLNAKAEAISTKNENHQKIVDMKQMNANEVQALKDSTKAKIQALMMEGIN